MRKLTLLAVCAVMLAQSTLAFSSTFSGSYACRASGPDFNSDSSMPVMFLPASNTSFPVMFLSTASNQEISTSFRAGRLLYYIDPATLCQYSLVINGPMPSSFSQPDGTGTGTALLAWTPVSGNPPSCVSFAFAKNVAFVLSGDARSLDPANVVQITDDLANYECTRQ